MPVTPAITCVIPVFNGMRDLERSTGSVLAQRRDVQLVLVDDVSTDGSREWILGLAAREPRVIALTLDENAGQGNARNVGVEAAAARYITFLDQDDEALPGWYDHAIEVLDAMPQYVGLRGEFELSGAGTHPLIGPGDPRWATMVNSAIWNVVMHKAVYQAVGGSPSGATFRTRQGNEDWVVTETIKKHFAMGKSEFVAIRHTVRPGNATDFFLGRTRVTGKGFEFIEQTTVEAQGQLAQAVADYQARAAAGVARYRATAAAPERPGALRGLAARLLDRLLGGPAPR